jgi:hypothetical protein
MISRRIFFFLFFFDADFIYLPQPRLTSLGSEAAFYGQDAGNRHKYEVGFDRESVQGTHELNSAALDNNLWLTRLVL